MDNATRSSVLYAAGKLSPDDQHRVAVALAANLGCSVVADGEAEGTAPSMAIADLRDWFAGQSLAAIIEADGIQYVSRVDDHARIAYEQAEAMLKARKMPGEPE